MTASAVRCVRCGQTFIPGESFSTKVDEDRLTSWLANHVCWLRLAKRDA